MDVRGRARSTGRYACVVLAAALAALLLIGVASREAAGKPGATRRAADAAVGASVAHPAGWYVERERYTYDGTYGYTLWRPGATSGEGGTAPVARVARSYDLRPDRVEARVRDRIAAYPDLPVGRREVAVGEGGLKGVAVGPIPGSTPSFEVYVAAKGSVYQINLYGENLSVEGKKLLSSLRFDGPSRSVASLGLEDGKKAESHYGRGNSEPSREEREARRKVAADARKAPKIASASPVRATAFSTPAVPAYDEYPIEEGCWRSASSFFYQTPQGYGANASPYDGIPTGFTVLGRPNYWGDYTHGNLGYGRCASTYYTNDKFAIDYPLNRGDYVFSPFSKGVVTFAGRNVSHKNYGIFVVIKADNGKYVSLSAHLDSLAAGIKPGATVTADSVIGYAGDSGDPSIPVGEPHVHQAFYRSPDFKPDGSPYGGAGLQAIYHHYTGTAAGTGPGVYQFGWTKTSTQMAKGSLISN